MLVNISLHLIVGRMELSDKYVYRVYLNTYGWNFVFVSTVLLDGVH